MNSSSSTSSAKLETSSLYRLTGTNLYSGLDTDSIIKALVSNTQSKIDKQGQLEQIAEWRRDLYRGVTTDMQKFRDTYFSYTSDTNLLSSTFFETAKIDSSSDVVSATGDVDSASTLVINNISQIASKAIYNSDQQVSNETITSGKIQDSWTQSTVGGKSMVVSYNGTNYTLTLSNSVKLDSEKMSADPTTELNKIVDGLNNSVSGNRSLKDKIKFSLDNNNKIVLTATSTDATSVSISPYLTSTDETTGPAFLEALGLTGTTQTANGSGQIVLTGNNALDTNVSTSGLFNKTVSSSSYLKLTANGENYTVKLGKNVILTGTLSTDLDNISKALQNQIHANSNLSGVTVSSEGNALTFTGATISGGSQNLMKGLNLTAGSSTGTAVTDESALKKSYFGDTLAGNTLTFKLDDVSKTITFNASDESKYSSAGDAAGDVRNLVSYLQGKLTTLFGTYQDTDGALKPKVQVKANDGGIQFTTGDKTSVLAITSSDSFNVLNECGALRIGYGETNRAETNKTLDQLAGEVNGHDLEKGTDGKYTISINGKELSFTGNTTLGDVINQINNDADTGVTVSYSKTTDSFTIKANDSGSQGKINFEDLSGNLASTLFGTSSMDFTGIHSNALPADENGAVTIAADGTYTVNLAGQTPKSVTLAAGTYRLTDLQNTLQKAVNDQFGAGKVNVAVKDGKLIFDSADGSALSITSTGDNNPLGIASGASNLSSSTSQTLASFFPDNSSTPVTIAGNNGSSLTIHKTDQGYTIGSDTTVYNGTETLYDAISGYTAGSDLKMNVTINGKTTDITRSTNTTTLDRVNLTFTGKTDTPVTFSSTGNVDDLVTKITDFVNDYNKIIDEVNKLTTESQERGKDGSVSYQPLTDDQKKSMTDGEIEKWNKNAEKGLLQNNDTLNGILTDLHTAMTDAVKSSGLSLSQLGISTQAYDTTSGGQLVVTAATLRDTLQKSPNAVAKLFTDADGVSTRMKDALNKYIGTFGGDGVLLQLAGTDSEANDTSQLTTQIKGYQSTITDLKSQLQTEENRYWDKFTAMEQALSVLTSQSDSLTSMFSGNSRSSS